MIRSVKLSLKFCNKSKKSKIIHFLQIYKEAVQFFIDECWETNEYKYISTPLIHKCPMLLTTRAKQCAGKQALGIIHQTRKKHNQRIFMRDKLANNGEDVSKLDRLISHKPNKPKVKNLEAELDSRFIKHPSINNTFDYWIRMTIGINKTIFIPLKKTKLFNKWDKIGIKKQGCRVGKDFITIIFECNKPINNNKEKIGIDIGINSIISTSNEQQIKSCPHGHTFNSILKKISRKQKKSKAFQRAVEHRKNFINWSIKQLNINKVRSIVIEDLYKMSFAKKNRFLSHFTYAIIFDRLRLTCEESNVSILEVNPAYTSQKCSKCEDIQTKNRNGEFFKCINCGYSQNADINAAKNILASV